MSFQTHFVILSPCANMTYEKKTIHLDYCIIYCAWGIFIDWFFAKGLGEHHECWGLREGGVIVWGKWCGLMSGW